MALHIYRLVIESGDPQSIGEILGAFSEADGKSWWRIQMTDSDSDYSSDYVGKFLGLLEGKYDELSKIGVNRSDVTIWVLYEYDNECNFEIGPGDMKKLGDNGIALCLSCWQSNAVN